MSSSAMIWQDKIALVTGGSSGIGLALARLLAGYGAHVWLLARRRDCLESALASLSCGAGQRCGIVDADVSDAEQVEAAVQKVIESAGHPHLLINSAGVTHPGLFQDLEPEIFHRLMAINYFGAVNTTRAVLPGMLVRGSGHIINISSLSGQIATIGYTAYAASKFALRGFTDALRSELKPLGIRLSIVFPPDTNTPQLAYENKFKPPVVKALGSFAGLVSPEYVARVTLSEAARGRYIIIPGLESKIWYRAYGLAGDLSYPILDWFIRQAGRKVEKSK